MHSSRPEHQDTDNYLPQVWDDRASSAAPLLVSVRALILALSRFEIASKDKTRVLEKEWATYRKNGRLTAEGKVAAELPEICLH
jgi:hypothetical protein